MYGEQEDVGFTTKRDCSDAQTHPRPGISLFGSRADS